MSVHRVTGRMWLPLAFTLLAAMLLLLPQAMQAQPAARFDLTGPRIDVHVQRGNKSLPIAMVPNLQAGDKLTIHADLPPTQSVKLLMVVAFLRGSTNPPPEHWFSRINTWDKKVQSEGVTLTVPDEAQQALIFLAPETGGDYSTLRSAVTGRPGVFVRAAQDLNEASFEQARIERYLQALRRVPPGSPAELLDHSHKLATTLNLKPNDDCFKKPADQQMSCLRQTGTQLLLDDGHGQTLASMITTGDTANLIGAVAATPMANTNGAGIYSAYVGTVIDVVRLMSGIHTAQFQYIPAIAFPDQETLNLRLNTPPSFHNPKSVIVVALPAIQQSVPPPLRLQNTQHVSCLLQPNMVLPLEGAPLVFATEFAHDLVLHLNESNVGGRTDLPLVPDAFEGGLVLSEHTDRRMLATAAPEARDSAANPTGMPANQANRHAGDAGDMDAAVPAAHSLTAADESGPVQVTGTLHGQWGFDSFEGVTVPLQRRPGTGWAVLAHADLIAGKTKELELQANGSACASGVDLQVANTDTPLIWKLQDARTSSQPPDVQVTLPPDKVVPGDVHLLVQQYGTSVPQKVAVTAYSDATHLDIVAVHAGDPFVTLTGGSLSGVRELRVGARVYTPAPDQSATDGKQLRLQASGKETKENGKVGALKAGDSGTAQATLNDGRTLPVTYRVDTARPSLELVSRSAKPSPENGLPLQTTSRDDLPLDSRLSFALKSLSPARFPRTQKVEIALTDGSEHTTLSVADGSLVLQDATTAIAFLSPRKSFGDSGFGPVQLRAVAEDGTVGDWIPLGTLVRMPTVTGLTCSRGMSRTPLSAPATPDAVPPASGDQPQAPQPCQLTGSNLFLIDAVAADSSFTNAVPVPAGFAADTLQAPRAADGHTLYLRLRDDPSTVFTITTAGFAPGASRKTVAQAPTSSQTP